MENLLKDLEEMNFKVMSALQEANNCVKSHIEKKESLIEELEKVNVDGKLDTIIEINEEIKKSCFEFSEKLRHTIENEKKVEGSL